MIVHVRTSILLFYLTFAELISCPQVIQGGDLDINFIVTGPQDNAVVMQPHSSDGLHGIDVKITGEYEICLDNSFSRMTGNG